MADEDDDIPEGEDSNADDNEAEEDGSDGEASGLGL